MANILTEDKKGLKIFSNGVQINEELNKWKNAKKGKTKSGTTYIIPQDMTTSDNGTSTSIRVWNTVNVDVGTEESTPFSGEYDKDLQFDDIATMELHELNKYINDHSLKYLLGSTTGRYESTNNFVSFGSTQPNPTVIKEIKFWDRVKNSLRKKEAEPDIDVVAFFTNVKSTSKESAKSYINRVDKYLKAIHNAKVIGQTALVEKLTREMIANKYESFLASEGHYYVVTEEQVANFLKKSSRGICLDYIKNFVRPIPECVIEKIAEADKLEVFDNYVIMHYDPEGKSTQDTAKEELKKRDPIVFGVIAGSKKLYYVADWIDEYCDLTLEKFVDTLGIRKSDLIQDKDDREREKKIEAISDKAKKELKETLEDKKPEKKKRATRKKKEDKN